ncbi:MAG TPA: CpaD family pilus assembly protein [Rhizomicrobium sp.]|jgi:pilus assembly protein CpaD|nr:CpaD family pilus assembly protein [Rhizomicrobium sp.]
MTKSDYLLRAAAITALLFAGSCAAPINGADSPMADPDVNHPITVEPGMASQRFSWGAGEESLNPADAARLDDMLADYRLHGSGSISINAPQGQAGRAAIGWFAERIAASGVSRDKILVATRDAPGDFKLALSYIVYRASTAPCGDWSDQLADTSGNLTPKNFGCAVQHNVAAMVADPRDLQGPRPMDGSDANRTATILSNYEQGKPTGAQKAPEQSGAVSDVDK